MSAKLCFLCKKDVDNEFDMGEWKRNGNGMKRIDVHYYCLVSYLLQVIFK